MGTDPRNDQSSEASVDHESPDRSPGKPIPSAPAVLEDINSSSSAQPPRTRVFTLFKRLPAELRVLIWEFACAPPGPRVHFLEPIADPGDGRVIFWDLSRHCWRNNESLDSERTPIIHWEISERMNDACFHWFGRELLSVCTEAKRVFLDQKTTTPTAPRDQTRVGFADMVRTTDLICIRAGFGLSGHFQYPLAEWGERETGFCHRDGRPSPCRVALEVPLAAASPDHHRRFWCLMPHWLSRYRRNQKFMRFDRLEEVYILDQHIRPRAHYAHQESMHPEMFTEAFDGPHGSKFVAIDPEDKQAVQLWIIPEHCWRILRMETTFPHFPYSVLWSHRDVEYNRRIADGSLLSPKLRFLACVRQGSNTEQIDDGNLDAGFAFTPRTRRSEFP